MCRGKDLPGTHILPFSSQPSGISSVHTYVELTALPLLVLSSLPYCGILPPPCTQLTPFSSAPLHVGLPLPGPLLPPTFPDSFKLHSSTPSQTREAALDPPALGSCPSICPHCSLCFPHCSVTTWYCKCLFTFLYLSLNYKLCTGKEQCPHSLAYDLYRYLLNKWLEEWMNEWMNTIQVGR